MGWSHGLRSGSSKWCPRCQCWLEDDAFRPNPNLRDGVESWCRSCHAEANREWREKNPEAVELYNTMRRAEYRSAHPLPSRPCVVCGRAFRGRPDALVCGPECRHQRKLEQRRAQRA